MESENYHMGDRLKNLLDDLGVNKERLSVKIGYSKKHIHKVLNREKISWTIIRLIGDECRIDIAKVFPDFPESLKVEADSIGILVPKDLNEAKRMLFKLTTKHYELMEKYTKVLEDKDS